MFFSSIVALLIPLVLGIFSIINFNKVFVVFHDIVFQGKENWIFNPELDPIVLCLPIEFFRNCAILIGSSLLIISVSSIVIQINNKYKKNYKTTD